MMDKKNVYIWYYSMYEKENNVKYRRKISDCDRMKAMNIVVSVFVHIAKVTFSPYQFIEYFKLT